MMGPIAVLSREEDLLSRLRQAIFKESWDEVRYLAGICHYGPDDIPVPSFVSRGEKCNVSGCEDRRKSGQVQCVYHFSRSEHVRSQDSWEEDFRNIPFSTARMCKHDAIPYKRGGVAVSPKTWCSACFSRGIKASCGHFVHTSNASRKEAVWNPETQIVEGIKCSDCIPPSRNRRVPKNRYGYVYRLFDKSGHLLYIGKTYRVYERLFSRGGHCYSKHWWNLVEIVDIQCFKTEDDALG